MAVIMGGTIVALEAASKKYKDGSIKGLITFAAAIGLLTMTEERKARLDLYREHCVKAEQALFDAIQTLSSKENMTAADASALAAVTEAMVSVQKMRY